jgi:hypothetical protein
MEHRVPMKNFVIAVERGDRPLTSQELYAALSDGRARIISSSDDSKDGEPSAAAVAAPSMLSKAANFATSAAKHIAAGMPQCSDAERERRFAICQGCEFYAGSACSKCGCPVVREQKFVSKLAWANEKCPVGKWGPEEVG